MLAWPDFIRESTAAAQQVIDQPGYSVDRYVYVLASFAVRLAGVPETPLFPFGSLDPKVSFGPSHKGVPFAVIQWRMEPSAVLPPHCHPNASVCTLGIEGEARIRNFEVCTGAPAFDSGSRQAFEVMETHDEVITSGRVNTLTPRRDNIHTFEAGPRGARGIDITSLHGPQNSFSFLRIERSPKDAKRRLFEAVWTGEEPKG